MPHGFLRKRDTPLLVAASLALFSGTASAVPVVTKFSANFTSGPLATMSFMGSFAIDSTQIVGSGTELFEANNDAKQVLSFEITVAGIDYSIEQTLFDGLPAVQLSNGMLDFFEYDGQSANGDRLAIIWFDGDAQEANFTPGNNDPQSSGSVTVLVPEPGTLALVAGGLGIALLRSRRRSGAGV